MKLLKKEEKPLLGRTDALVEIEFQGAVPSLPEMKKKAALEMKTKEELVDVYKVEPVYGEQKVKAIIHAYNDENAYKEFRIVPPAEKKAAAEAAKKAAEAPAEGEAAPAEAPAEEKPAEEAPKEEAPKEEAPAEEPKAEEAPKEEEKPAEEEKKE